MSMLFLRFSKRWRFFPKSGYEAFETSENQQSKQNQQIMLKLTANATELPIQSSLFNMSELIQKEDSVGETPDLIKQEDSTANSVRNTPPIHQSALQFQIPSTYSDAKPQEIIGGAPVRQWLNEKVTPVLLEGVRKISKDRPEDPLKALGEYLIEQSKQQQQQ